MTMQVEMQQTINDTRKPGNALAKKGPADK
jgi:hypothetical protein